MWRHENLISHVGRSRLFELGPRQRTKAMSKQNSPLLPRPSQTWHLYNSREQGVEHANFALRIEGGWYVVGHDSGTRCECKQPGMSTECAPFKQRNNRHSAKPRVSLTVLTLMSWDYANLWNGEGVLNMIHRKTALLLSGHTQQKWAAGTNLLHQFRQVATIRNWQAPGKAVTTL